MKTNAIINYARVIVSPDGNNRVVVEVLLDDGWPKSFYTPDRATFPLADYISTLLETTGCFMVSRLPGHPIGIQLSETGAITSFAPSAESEVWTLLSL